MAKVTVLSIKIISVLSEACSFPGAYRCKSWVFPDEIKELRKSAGIKPKTFCERLKDQHIVKVVE